MSQNSNESQGASAGNPAWKPFLDKIPESMHAMITPILRDWDAGVQQKLQEVRSQYAGAEAYKPFIDAQLDPQMIQQSLMLFDQFRTNPQKVIAEAIQAYDLPYVDSSAITPDDDDDDYEDDNEVDITKNPQFQQIQQTLQQMQERDQSREQAELNAQAEREHVEWLNEMQKPDNHGQFDPVYVTALMSQGVDGEKAIEMYKTTIANATQVNIPNQQQTQAPPVVMGGNGTSGSGLPESPINFGGMKRNDINEMVDNMLQAAAEQNNQG